MPKNAIDGLAARSYNQTLLFQSFEEGFAHGYGFGANPSTA